MTTLRYQKQDSIATVTLDRPEKLNAVNLAMRDELWEAFLAFRDDPDARVLVLRGEGRAFCAGADITEFGTAPTLIEARHARLERDLWGLLLHLPKPTIAAIHGHAYGAGCEMALFCDLRVAADDASFALPEVSLGYIPSAGGTQTLPRVIRPGRALQIILAGDPVDAVEAARIGLVHRVVERAHLDEAVTRWALLLAGRPPRAVSYAKQAVSQGLDLSLEQGLALERRLAALLRSP
jgi:enoyl-CoA hydratase/carnithine racemase